jgi:hypothetical protein
MTLYGTLYGMLALVVPKKEIESMKQYHLTAVIGKAGRSR